MTLTFPNSPALNETIIYKDKVYKYDGKKWVSGFLKNNAISTEYVDYKKVTPTPEINLDLRKYNFFELNLGTSPNLFSYPEDFTKNPPWFISGLNGTITGGQTVLTPNYTKNANKITEDTTASATRIILSYGDFVKDKTYTVSVYVKRATGTRNFGFVLPQTAFGVFVAATYNLETGTYTLSAPTGSVNASAAMTNEGDGWYRCSITATATTTANETIQFRMITTNVYWTYTGDGTSSIYIWGAKLEEGNLTSYIPPEITNKLKYSEQFSNNVWQKNGSTITPNQISAPDGTLTADLLLETDTNAEHKISYTINPSLDLTNRNYTWSIYVKKYNRSNIIFRITDASSFVITRFNLDTATSTVLTSTGSAVAVSSSITPDIDGWYRISLTGRTGTNTSQIVQLILLNDAEQNPYTGDVTKGIYIWGAQFQKDTLTSYQKTEELAYYNVKLTESTDNDMFLLKINNQIKPNFNLDLTTTSAMPYDNYNTTVTATADYSYSITNYGFFVSPDGSKTYTSTGANISSSWINNICQNNLSTPWNITSTFLSQGRSAFNGRLTVDYTSPPIVGIYISNDGINMYICKYTTSSNIYHYTMYVPWNINTASLFGTYSISQSSNLSAGITFKPDGTSMYILGVTSPLNTSAIHEYTLSIPWRVSSATYANSFSVTAINNNVGGLQFSPDGTKVFFTSLPNSRMYQLDLSTAWKINTAVNNNKYVSVSSVVSPYSFTISPDGLKTFIQRTGASQSTATIYQYSSAYLGALDYTISWPTNIKWENGSPPSISKSNQNTLIEFYKYNGIWNAKLLADDI